MPSPLAFPIQARLVVRADDPYEQEAERVARQVLLSPPGGAEAPTPTPGVQPLQRASIDSGAGLGAVAPELEQQIGSLAGGQPLTAADQAFFSERFGTGFDHVHIHVRPDLTAALNAEAFTVGSDIVFDPGSYAPGTEAGRELLAHELTHVLQQTGGQGGAALARSVQRRPAADEGVCPICGKIGRGTCPDCGQPFVPIQRAADGTASRVVQRKAKGELGLAAVTEPAIQPLAALAPASAVVEPQAQAAPASQPGTESTAAAPVSAADTRPGVTGAALSVALAPRSELAATPVPPLTADAPAGAVPTAGTPVPADPALVAPVDAVPPALANLMATSADLTPADSPELPSMAGQPLDVAWDHMLRSIAATHASAHAAAAHQQGLRPTPPSSVRPTAPAPAAHATSLAGVPIPASAFTQSAGLPALDPLAAARLARPSEPERLALPPAAAPLARGEPTGFAPLALPLAPQAAPVPAPEPTDGRPSAGTTPAMASDVAPAAVALEGTGTTGLLPDGAAPRAQGHLRDDEPALPGDRGSRAADLPEAGAALAADCGPLRTLQRSAGTGDSSLASLIPDWVQDALAALRGDANRQQRTIEGQGQADQERVDHAAQASGAAIQADGQAKGDALQAQGQTVGTALLADGQAQAAELQAGQHAQTAELQAGHDQQIGEMQAGQAQQRADLHTAQQQQRAKLQEGATQQRTELELAQLHQAEQLQAAADTKGAELDTAAQAQQHQLQADFATAEQAAEVRQQALTTQAETRASALQTGAMALEEQARRRWATLEQHASSAMADLNAQAASRCAAIQQQATAYLDTLDPLIADAQAGWQQIQASAQAGWAGLQAQAQPVLDMLGQQWESFSTWFGQEVWPSIQQQASEFASWAADSTGAAWSWLQSTWRWLQDRWTNAEQTIAGLADAARGWLGDQIQAAQRWIGDQAEAAHTFVIGKAEAAHDWIAGKADAAQVWIGDQAASANAWMGATATGARDWVGDQANAAQVWIGDQAASANAWMAGRADAVTKGFHTLGTGVVSGLASHARAATSAVARRGGPLLEWFAGIVNGLIAGVERAGTAAVEQASGALQRGLGAVADQTRTATSFLATCASGAVTLVQYSATDVVNLVEHGASGAVNTVASTASGAVTGVQTAASSAVDVVASAASTAVAGVGAAGQGVATALEQQAQGTVALIKDAGQAVSAGWGALSSAAGTALDGLGQRAAALTGWLGEHVVGPVSHWASAQWEALPAGCGRNSRPWRPARTPSLSSPAPPGSRSKRCTRYAPSARSCRAHWLGI